VALPLAALQFEPRKKPQNAYRLDRLVDDPVVVELQAVEKLAPVHPAQLLTYLTLSPRRISLRINLHTLHLRDRCRRMVHG